MDNDSKGFEHAAAASSADACGGSDLLPDAASDPFGAIGYEAADPSLQNPMWDDVMQNLQTRPDW
jgi:hypothetical protein